MRIVRRFVSASCLATTLAVGVPLWLMPLPASAQARPSDATAQCKDGSYSKAQTRRGACSGHGGVATWFGDAKAAADPAAAKGAAKPAAEGPKAERPKPTTTEPKATPGRSGTKSAAGAPENATAKCKDGTYSFSKTHRGACSHHGGVAEWYK